MKQRLLKMKQAAVLYGVTVPELLELIHDGEVPSVTVGRYLRVPAAEMDAEIAAQITVRHREGRR